jgi:2-dehydro-3-deoxygluconokinase
MTEAIDILSMGEPMVEFNQLPGGDGCQFLRGFGGDTSNFAIAAARQGARAGYISAVGDDAGGALFRELWSKEGVGDTYVRTIPDTQTGIYFVSHNASGHHFEFRRTGSAASRISAPDLPLAAIANAKILHLSAISLGISTSACDAGYAAIAHARKNGTTVSFDTNLRLKLWPKDRARAVIWDVASLADVCLPSYEDMVQLSDLREPDDIVDRFLTMGPNIIALKLGTEGALVADKTHRYKIAPYPCRAVDATGAGDTFGGAFIARLVAGDDIEAAGHYAAAAASLSTEGYGAVAPIPTVQQVQILMQSSGSANVLPPASGRDSRAQEIP